MVEASVGECIEKMVSVSRAKPAFLWFKSCGRLVMWALVAVTIASCHDGNTPTQSKTVALQVSFPQSIQYGKPFEFTVTFNNAVSGQDWASGSIDVGIPIVNLEKPVIVSTNATEAQVGKGSPESGGWEIFVDTTPFPKGAQVTVTATAVIQSGGQRSARIQFQGVAHDFGGLPAQEMISQAQDVAIGS